MTKKELLQLCAEAVQHEVERLKGEKDFFKFEAEAYAPDSDVAIWIEGTASFHYRGCYDLNPVLDTREESLDVEIDSIEACHYPDDDDAVTLPFTPEELARECSYEYC